MESHASTTGWGKVVWREDGGRVTQNCIWAKVQIVVEHYRENVQPLLAGRAKAMVVGSRKEAVRWQKAIRAYIARQNYPPGVLVAFSGEVNDPKATPRR